MYVVQSDGTGEARLNSARIDHFDLAEWSPDGTTLVFGAAMVDEEDEDLWVVALDGKPERRIVAIARRRHGPHVVARRLVDRLSERSSGARPR